MPTFLTEFKVSGGWGEYSYHRTHFLLSENCSRESLPERIRNKIVKTIRGNEKKPTYVDRDLNVRIVSVMEIKEILDPAQFNDCIPRAIGIYTKECADNLAEQNAKAAEEQHEREKREYERLRNKFA